MDALLAQEFLFPQKECMKVRIIMFYELFLRYTFGWLVNGYMAYLRFIFRNRSLLLRGIGYIYSKLRWRLCLCIGSLWSLDGVFTFVDWMHYCSVKLKYFKNKIRLINFRPCTITAVAITFSTYILQPFYPNCNLPPLVPQLLAIGVIGKWIYTFNINFSIIMYDQLHQR